MGKNLKMVGMGAKSKGGKKRSAFWKRMKRVHGKGHWKPRDGFSDTQVYVPQKELYDHRFYQSIAGSERDPESSAEAVKNLKGNTSIQRKEVIIRNALSKIYAKNVLKKRKWKKKAERIRKENRARKKKMGYE